MKKVLGINVNLSAVSWALADRAESDSETGALLWVGIRLPNLLPVLVCSSAGQTHKGTGTELC